MKSIYFILFSLAFSVSHALTPAFPAPTSGIFSSYEILNFKLTAPISTLLKAKELSFFATKKVVVEGTLSYTDHKNKNVQIPVKINIKGFTSTQFCTLPKLELKLDKTLKKNTLFENIKSIDLHTHCIEQEDTKALEAVKVAFNAHREAMLYRYMDILEIPGFRARPIMMEYQDTDANSIMQAKSGFLYQAFFLEDYGDFRKRNNLKAIRGVNDVTKTDTDPTDTEKLASYVFSHVEQHPAVDRDDVARAVLFQHLIGNGDYFIQTTSTGYRDGSPTDENLWNMKIVENTDGKWITIPQDFNFSLILLNYPVVPSLEMVTFNLASPETQINLYKSFANKKAELIKATDLLQAESVTMKNHLERVFQNIESHLQ
ncbi:MAG: hypothetical protein V4654_09510 [Bdellovibrionota bacterium]